MLDVSQRVTGRTRASAAAEWRGTAWRTMLRAPGLPDGYIPKTIRHTVITEMRRKGVPPEQILVLVGHRSADMERMAAVRPSTTLAISLTQSPRSRRYSRRSTRVAEAGPRDIASRRSGTRRWLLSRWTITGGSHRGCFPWRTNGNLSVEPGLITSKMTRCRTAVVINASYPNIWKSCWPAVHRQILSLSKNPQKSVNIYIAGKCSDDVVSPCCGLDLSDERTQNNSIHIDTARSIC